jgi:hypothetical protein
MRIQHALGLAGGAAGVAQPRRGVFVEAAPLRRRMRLDQRLVGREAGDSRRGQIGALSQQYHALERRAGLKHGLDQRQKCGVDEENAIFGMVDDIDELRRMQPGVQGMAHGADAHGRVPHFHMLRGIPGQCRNTVAGSDAERR